MRDKLTRYDLYDGERFYTAESGTYIVDTIAGAREADERLSLLTRTKCGQEAGE